jgi:hypothetical protein
MTSYSARANVGRNSYPPVEYISASEYNGKHGIVDVNELEDAGKSESSESREGEDYKPQTSIESADPRGFYNPEVPEIIEPMDLNEADPSDGKNDHISKSSGRVKSSNQHHRHHQNNHRPRVPEKVHQHDPPTGYSTWEDQYRRLEQDHLRLLSNRDLSQQDTILQKPHIDLLYDIQDWQSEKFDPMEGQSINTQHLMSYIAQSFQILQKDRAKLYEDAKVLQKNLDLAHETALSHVDRFEPILDSKLENMFHQILGKIRQFSRYQPRDPEHLGNQLQEHTLTKHLPQSYWSKSKRSYQPLLESVVWRRLFKNVFRNPFNIYGDVGKDTFSQWNFLFNGMCCTISYPSIINILSIPQDHEFETSDHRDVVALGSCALIVSEHHSRRCIPCQFNFANYPKWRALLTF